MNAFYVCTTLKKLQKTTEQIIIIIQEVHTISEHRIIESLLLNSMLTMTYTKTNRKIQGYEHSQDEERYQENTSPNGILVYG